jgi:hypothetical protein
VVFSTHERLAIARWNGVAWIRASTPRLTRASVLIGAAAGARSVWAVGGIAAPGNRTRTLILHWNGTTWKRVRS